MVIRAGFKETQIGVIPEDWEVKALGGLFKFSGGLSASREQLSLDGYCYLHYGDIHGSKKSYIDVQSEYHDIPKLDVPLRNVSPASLLNDGDVVFVDASEDDEGASRHVVIVNPDGIPFISGLHTIVAKGNTDTLTNQFRRYCFQTAAVKAQFRHFAVGIKVTGISKANIAKIMLPVPSTPEQTAIASALSDTEDLLNSLEKLIAKKRDIKRGAMQQLLTGKKRLPEFSGEWKVTKLGEAFQFLNTANNPRSHLSERGEVKYIHYGDIHTWPSPFFDCQKESLPLIDADKVKNVPFLEDGDLVMVDASEDYAGLGKSFEVQNTTDRRVVAGLHTLLLRGEKDCWGDGFKGYLPFIPSVRQALIQVATGISVYGVSKNNVKNIEVRLPDPEEQTAIAQVLSDMDAEISALETKVSKARLIKQGMMQELLTGRVRLI